MSFSTEISHDGLEAVLLKEFSAYLSLHVNEKIVL